MTRTQPTFRRAGPDDAERLAEIGRRTFAEAFGQLYAPDDLAVFLEETHGLDRVRAALADPAEAFWLAQAGDETVGYARAGPCGLPHAEVTPACGELKRLYLLGPWQGGGTGRRLFAEVLAWLERDGPRTLWIGVWSQNLGAQRLYARFGFETVGEYGFRVGRAIDRELILRRAAVR
jgi:diamine N-acetyltransferase